GRDVRQLPRPLRREHGQSRAVICRSVCAIVATMLACAAVRADAATPLPLVDAVRDGNRAVVQTLLRQKTNVNAAQADGTTALHWAVRADDRELIGLLLHAGAD